MNSNVVDMIKDLLKDKSLSPYDIINDYGIRKKLDEIFEDRDSFTTSELKYFTSDKKVQNVITLYLYEEGIELLGNNSYVTGIGNPDLDILALYFGDMRYIPLLTPEEEKQLFIKLDNASDQEECDAIKEKIIISNLRLVAKFATKNQNRGLSLPDLIQEGNLGLIKAVDRFDVTKGYKFSTYATQWIRQSINNAIAEQSRDIKYPKHIHYNLKKLRADYYKETGTRLYINSEATVEEYADKMGVKKDFLEKLLKLPTTISLETPVNMYDDFIIHELQDFVPDESKSGEVAAVDKKEQEEIRELLNDKTFTERDRVVLIKRYGLYDSEEFTLEEIGNELNLSCEGIRQIQRKAESKLKDCAIKKGFSYVRR